MFGVQLALLWHVIVVTDLVVGWILNSQAGGRSEGNELESGSTAGELSQAKHDELVEGVGDGKPVVRKAAGAMDGPHALTVETSGSGSGSGVGDESVSQLGSSTSDKLSMGASEVETRQEEEIPPGQAEQAGGGSGSGSGTGTDVVVEGRNGSSSEVKDSTVAVGDGGS
jgi:hypothetical protein